MKLTKKQQDLLERIGGGRLYDDDAMLASRTLGSLVSRGLVERTLQAPHCYGGRQALRLTGAGMEYFSENLA